MGAVWMVARGELRRRWASLLGLAVLVAVVSAAVLTSLVGARRTSTTVARFREWSRASDAAFQSDDDGKAARMLAAIRGLPDVEMSSLRVLVNAFPVDGTTPDIAIMSDPDGVYGRQLERPRLLEGRMPGRDAPDEILLNELATQVTGYGLGDHIRASTWSDQDLEALFGGPQFPGFNGPKLDLVVVGIGRTAEELPGDVRRTAPYAVASPAFLAGHPGVGAWPAAVLVRLADGGDLGAVSAAVAPIQGVGEGSSDQSGFSADATTAQEVYLESAQSTVNGLAAGLLVFALAAAVAGAIAIGQAIDRQIAAASNPTKTLSALGLTGMELACARTLPIASAGAVGVVAGGLGAVAASPLLPVGLARRAEVDPGVWALPAILVPGAAVILTILALWSLLRARRADRPSGGSRRVPVASRLAAGAAARPPVAVGVHLASDRGRGDRAIPVRSAVAGVAIAVAGVLAAAVVASSVHHLTGDPTRWGADWSAMPDYFGDGDLADVEAGLVADDRVEAVGQFVAASVVLDGHPITAHSLRVLKGAMAFTGLDGRLPGGPGEVALGRQTLRDLGVSLGDTVEARSPSGEGSRALEVVGTVVIPPTDEYGLDRGAVFGPDGLDGIVQGEPTESLVIRYPDDTDPRVVERRLSADYGLQFGRFTRPEPPGAVRSLGDSRSVAVALALFFGVLGVIGLLHALTVSTRRRRGDLAVLRALGFQRRQVRQSILTEALVLTMGGLLIGVPAGIVVGRLVWRSLVRAAAVTPGLQTPWVVIALAVPVGGVLAATVAWWPGRSAVQARPAHQLRAE